MKRLLLEEIIKAADGMPKNGFIEKGLVIDDISTDTRNIKPGSLFVPLIGKNFDGHDFIKAAFEKGATACISSKAIDLPYNIIMVEDTGKALLDIAEYYRQLFDIPVAAVTGSTGKTTTKEIVYSVIKQKYNAIKTEGNFNNAIGLPLSVFRINDDTKAAVLELGMNNFGEIHALSKAARPNIAVITNIGVSHIENLGSREGILKAKTEVFDFMPEDGIKILNGDDDMLITYKNKREAVFYGTDKGFPFYADNIAEYGIRGLGCEIHMPNCVFEVKISVPGRHMVSNALAAAAVGYYMKISPEAIKAGIENFTPAKMRMNVIKTDRYTIIDDAYNANPNSVRAAVDVIAAEKGNRVCILGDMLELGGFADRLHFETGEYAAEKGIELIICIGRLSRHTYEGAKARLANNQRAYYFDTAQAFSEASSMLEDGAVILVKASRGMQFEKIVEQLKSNEPKNTR